MNATTNLERSLAAWLEQAGPDHVPGRVIAAALAEAHTVGQRPAWLPRPSLRVSRPPLRLAWAVAALLALLALLGGLLVVGAPRNQSTLLTGGCPAGSTPDQPGPVDQARPAGALTSVVWDAGGGRGVLAFAVKGWTVPWTFDVCLNTWHRSGSEIPWERNDAVVYDVDSRLVVGVGQGMFWHYDAEVGEVTAHDPEAPEARRLADPRAIYDPVTGLVVVLDRTFLWTYDVDGDTWREIVPVGRPGPDLSAAGYSLVTYDQSADRIVLYRTGPAVNTGMRTGEFDLRARTWVRSDVPTPWVNLGFFADDEVVYDEANARTVLFSLGTVAAYDATADTWTIAYGPRWSDNAIAYGRYDRRPSAIAYDRLNRRLVVFGGELATKDRGWVPVDDVVAFDLRTGEWRELLAPSSPVP